MWWPFRRSAAGGGAGDQQPSGAQPQSASESEPLGQPKKPGRPRARWEQPQSAESSDAARTRPCVSSRSDHHPWRPGQGCSVPIHPWPHGAAWAHCSDTGTLVPGLPRLRIAYAWSTDSARRVAALGLADPHHRLPHAGAYARELEQGDPAQARCVDLASATLRRRMRVSHARKNSIFSKCLTLYYILTPSTGKVLPCAGSTLR